MGILDKLGRTPESKKDINQSLPTREEEKFELTKEEYEFLFSLIKNSTFKGSELQVIFNILTKLQTRYIGMTNK